MALLTTKFVEVCIFKFENDTPQYLLLHRSKTEKVYPDLWQFVSGSIEKDEKAVDAALRELKEETGFTPHLFWVVPFVNTFHDPHYDSINCSPMFAAQVKPGSQPVLSSEHYEYEWLKYNDAAQRLVWEGQREALRVIHECIVRGGDAMKHSRIW